MNLEAQPWIADFPIAAALDSFPFFGVFEVGVLSVCFLRFGVEFWGVTSFLRPAHLPRSMPGLIWLIRPLYCGTGHVF